MAAFRQKRGASPECAGTLAASEAAIRLPLSERAGLRALPSPSRGRRERRRRGGVLRRGDGRYTRPVLKDFSHRGMQGPVLGWTISGQGISRRHAAAVCFRLQRGISHLAIGRARVEPRNLALAARAVQAMPQISQAPPEQTIPYITDIAPDQTVAKTIRSQHGGRHSPIG